MTAINRLIKFTLWGALVLAFVSINSTQVFGVSLSQTFSVDSVSITTDTTTCTSDCDSISYTGLSNLDVANYPNLPFLTIALLLPNDTEVDDISITTDEDTTISLSNRIIPGRALNDEDLGTAADTCYDEESSVYDTSAYWPLEKVEYIRTELFDGCNSVAFFNIYPVRYHPVDSTIEVTTSIAFTVNTTSWTGVDLDSVTVRHKVVQEAYNRGIVSLIENPEDSSYYYKPTVVDTSLSGTFNNGLPFADYVIIAPDDVHDELQPLCDWLNIKGVETVIASIDSVLAEYSGDEDVDDNPAKLKSYIKELYGIGTGYVLLVGSGIPTFDEDSDDSYDVIPLRMTAMKCGDDDDYDDWANAWACTNGGFFGNTLVSALMPSDQYYCDLFGIYNSDDDNLIGEALISTPNCGDTESPKLTSDIFVSRLPLNPSSNITNWINKTLNIEQNPGNGEYSFLNRSFGYSYYHDHMKIGVRDWLAANGCSSQDSQYTDEHDTSPDASDLVDIYSEGVNGSGQYYQVYNYSHGSRKHYNVCDGSEMKGYSTSEPSIDSVTNGPYPFFVHSQSCNTGGFQLVCDNDLPVERNIAVSWLGRGNESGAFAYIGKTTRIGDPDLMVNIQNAIYNSPGRHIGEIVATERANRGNGYMLSGFSTQYYGSPEMRIWTTGSPSHFEVVVNYADSSVTVKNASTSENVNDATVCFTNLSDTWFVDTESSNGIYYCNYGFDLDDYITVTKHDYIPYQVMPMTTISSDVVWRGDIELPDTQLIVGSNACLTIKPGSEIRVRRGGYLKINGTLIAEGDTLSTHNEIVFTADTSGTIPSDFWDGIWANQSDSIIFKYCKLEYAKNGLYLGNTDLSRVENCTFSNNDIYGIYARHDSDSCCFIKKTNIESSTYGAYLKGYNYLEQDTITECTRYGIYQDTTGITSVKDCIIEFNGITNDSTQWGIYLHYPSTGTKHCRIKGGSVEGYYQGGISIERADNTSYITGNIEVLENNIYGIYLKYTDLDVEGDPTDQSYKCNSIQDNKIGLYTHDAEGTIRRNYFENDSIDIKVPAVGVPNPTPTVSDSNVFSSDVKFIFNAGSDTLDATYNYWDISDDTTNGIADRITGPVDYSNQLESDPCDAGGSRLLADELLPRTFALHQNYPNPFNPATTMQYDLPKDCYVKITLFNILGQKVRTLVDGYQSAGYRSVVWDGKNQFGKDISTGVYFYLMEAEDFHKSKKMLMLK